MPIAVSYISTFITGFVLAFARGWRLALALSSILPVIVTIGIIMTTFMTRYSTAALDQTAKSGSLAEEVIGSIRTMQAFGTSFVLGKKFDHHVENSRRSGAKGTVVEAGGMCGMCKSISVILLWTYTYR